MTASHVRASAELAMGHAWGAATLPCAFDALAQVPDHLPGTPSEADHTREVATVREALGEMALGKAWEKDQARTPEAAVASTEGDAP